jgi:hypothetical protein
MGFVPMYFGSAYRIIAQAHRSDPFELPPAALAVNLSQPRPFTNRRSNGNRFNVRDSATYLEIHLLATADAEPSQKSETKLGRVVY